MKQSSTHNSILTTYPVWPFGTIVSTDEIEKRNENLTQDIADKLWKEILSDILILSQYLRSSQSEYAVRFFQWLQQRNIGDLTETCDYFKKLNPNTDLWIPPRCIKIFTTIQAII